MGFLAGIDHYILVFPVDAMIVSAVLIHPRKWISLSVCFALGSAVGALSIAYFTTVFGPHFIESYFPNVIQSSYWAWTQSFFTSHGLWLILLAAAAPVPQQPAMIVAALAAVPLWKIAALLSLGRFFKFFLIGYLAASAPAKLRKLWPLKRELEEFDVPTEVKGKRKIRK